MVDFFCHGCHEDGWMKDFWEIEKIYRVGRFNLLEANGQLRLPYVKFVD